MSDRRRWYAPPALWRRGRVEMSRRAALLFGTLFLALLVNAVALLIFGDLSGLPLFAWWVIAVSTAGATYTYFAHAIFNTTGRTERPEASA